MSNVWDRFEGIAGIEEVKEAKDAFAPTPAGTYEAILEKIEAALTSQGLPMLKAQFVRVDGGRKIFYNHQLQNINNPQYTPGLIGSAVTFIEKLTGEDYEFEGISKMAQKVEEIQCGRKYLVKVAYGAKDPDMKFPKITIVREVVEETGDPYEGVEDMTEF